MTTPSPRIAPGARRNTVKYRDTAPRGKYDLVVDLNFRMDTSALYSDIVLPAAFWYEKNDLNTTDLHSFLHVLGAGGAAGVGIQDGLGDLQAAREEGQRNGAARLSRTDAGHGTCTPLMHDTPDELAQPEILDWAEGECEPVPGKTFPHLRVVERDYANLYNKFISFGPRAREEGISAVGVQIPIKRQYDQMLENPIMPMPDPRHMRCVEWGGKRYPSLEDVLDAANTILATAPESNGEVCYQAFHHEQEHVGLPLVDIAEPTRASYRDVLRPHAAAEAHSHQPVLDRHDQRRPRLLGLVHER